MTLQDFRLWNSPWILRSPSPRSPSPCLQESRVSASVAPVGHCPQTCGCQMVAVTWHVTSRSWDSTQDVGRSGRISNFILMIDGKWEMLYQLHSRCLRMWSIMMCRKWWLQDLEITLRFTQLVCWSPKFVDLKKGRNGGKKPSVCLQKDQKKWSDLYIAIYPELDDIHDIKWYPTKYPNDSEIWSTPTMNPFRLKIPQQGLYPFN